ncbi:hypothetical protein COV20_01115 [Candidatus Woesearchaeota archaeon CG10_big_fil_rev_8_21_14_0_10_45_16]|nr:MAG: hypothetical protein COV20_01115 [Candidatus Woesearchaeota archaeon CG10_big_fil_rev_8_21_14_0_10_45_16]
MLDTISADVRNTLASFSEDDAIIFNNKLYRLDRERYEAIPLADARKEAPRIAFIDGGQAEILSAGNLSVSFIRVAAAVFKRGIKLENLQEEFYLFTKAVWHGDDLYYHSTIYGSALIQKEDLYISSNDASIKIGSERAPISKVANMARRFAELALAAKVDADHVVLDGTLEKTFRNEEKYLEKLSSTISAVAKSSSLFTTSGNSPVVLLNKIGPEGCWRYSLDEAAHFVKLHPASRHVFRFEGDTTVLSSLLSLCSDALFLGYPYGLLMADQLARVSNAEKKSLRLRLLLNKDNSEIVNYLQTMNAHDILDTLG